MDLNDILRQSQGGNGYATLARQFGLDQDQMARAIDALAPAFASGLQRNTADPLGMLNFMEAISTGRHARYYDDPQNAFTREARAEGEAILGHLFGSKDVSRALTDQAFQATGIGQSILKQLLPIIASMVLGGLFKQGQSGANPMLEEILRQLGGAKSGRSRRGPLDRYEDEQARRPTRPRAERTAPPGGAGDNPFGRMLEEMLGGRRSSEGARDGAGSLGEIFDQFARTMPGKPASGGKSGPAGTPRVPTGRDIFGDMFEPARTMGDAYQKNVETIFDQFLGGASRRR